MSSRPPRKTNRRTPITASPAIQKSADVRLNKAIADSGLCSRRKADELILAGHVSVNGKRVKVLGTTVSRKDSIAVKGKPLPSVKPLYLAFHKPKGYLTTRSDDQGRQTIYNLLPDFIHSVDAAGRLDRDTSGLLILSNDGDFLHRITHPSFHCSKRYRVTTAKPLTEAAAKALFDGMMFKPENKIARVESLQALPVDGTHPNEWPYEVTLLTGLNRQIRRSFEMVGFPVLKLKRIGFGAIKLGQLKMGEFRPLKSFEIQQLLKPSQAVAKKSAKAGKKESAKSAVDNAKKDLAKEKPPQKISKKTSSEVSKTSSSVKTSSPKSILEKPAAKKEKASAKTVAKPVAKVKKESKKDNLRDSWIESAAKEIRYQSKGGASKGAKKPAKKRQK